MSSPKQVIVIRKDLKMRRGKEIAQGSHASMAFMSHLLRGVSYCRSCATAHSGQALSKVQREWVDGSFAKVCLQVNSEAELIDVFHKAQEAGLTVHLITDSGKTEFGGVPTNTCLAIGPDYPEKIDPITGSLKLY